MRVVMNNLCPCNSGSPYQECCQPLHSGKAAETPEQLMRSRYTAFAMGLMEYLQQTWCAQHRPADLQPNESIQWKRLEVLDRGAEGDQGWVKFRATFQEGDKWMQLQERSRFIKEQGRWLYVDGDATWTALSVGRNDPCPCGSGKKNKKCCE
ncbi:uncharacterized protein conserved in bacteria [Hahella chejuensis KCTC 2396]|uniref:UPF0225 protein HCH_01502 n=2 Tax=Hahella chejuensis TaxID=158327 RepID=Q2SLW4_HAHCH|nr:uncharacterized protein conserved in bacteria [Hahella chejuensis KCTC 2396]